MMKKKRYNGAYSPAQRRAFYVGYSRGLGIEEKYIDKNSDANFMTYNNESAIAYYNGLIAGNKNKRYKKSRFRKRFK